VGDPEPSDARPRSSSACQHHRPPREPGPSPVPPSTRAPRLRVRRSPRFCRKRYALTSNPDSEILPLIRLERRDRPRSRMAVLDPQTRSAWSPRPLLPRLPPGSKPCFRRCPTSNTMRLEPAPGVPPRLPTPSPPIPTLRPAARLMFLNYPNNPTGGTAKPCPFLLAGGERASGPGLHRRA